jgi:hypothetical protein
MKINLPGEPRALGLLLCVALAACTSTGVGTGESPGGHVQAEFTWKQSRPTSGTLDATVIQRNGTQEHYSGMFYQITRDTDIDSIAPLWRPWWPRWRGWAAWGPVPTEAFVTEYTGHVVANLEGPSGQRMRCQFRLLSSDEGMKGGGEGRCQLPSGQTINADFAPT